MFRQKGLNVFRLTGRVCTVPLDFRLLLHQCFTDRIHFARLVETVDPLASLFFTAVQLLCGRSKPTVINQNIVRQTKGGEVSIDFHMEDILVIFSPGVVQIRFPGGTPKPVGLCAVRDFLFQYRPHSAALPVEHAVIKERGHQFTVFHCGPP